MEGEEWCLTVSEDSSNRSSASARNSSSDSSCNDSMVDET